MRKPVATAPDSPNNDLFIICDDGAVFRLSQKIGVFWEEVDPIPGTERDRNSRPPAKSSQALRNPRD